MKEKNTVKLVAIIFSIVGIGLLIGTYFAIKSTAVFLEVAELTNGQVIAFVEHHSSDSGTTYAPVIRFTTSKGENVEIESSVSSSPPSYSVGETVEVLYDPANPNDARINSFTDIWLLPLILGIMGIVFSGVGLGILVFNILKKRKTAILKQTGRLISTEYKEVTLNTSLNVNGRNPFIIISHWMNPTTGELHVFKSENIWFDPEEHINQKNISVYIDSNNPKKYYMDVSFLPKIAK